MAELLTEGGLGFSPQPLGKQVAPQGRELMIPGRDDGAPTFSETVRGGGSLSARREAWAAKAAGAARSKPPTPVAK